MNNQEFTEVVERRLEKIKSILANKSKEYSSDTDRLHNFKVAARLESIPESPEKSLWGMMKKHTVSVIDIIDGTTRGVHPTPATRDEKIGDMINYLILLEALLVEHDKEIPLTPYQKIRRDLDESKKS